MAAHVQEFGDWDAFAKKLDPKRFRLALAKEAKKANARIGSVFTAWAKKRIQASAYEPNSPMTEALKGSSKPLVDDGDLLGSITWSQDPSDPLALWVGVNRFAKNANIAKILHEGATLKVTQKMRAAVFARLSELAKGGGRKAQMAREFLAKFRTQAAGSAPKAPLQRDSKGRYLSRVEPKKPGNPKQRKFFFAKLRKEGKLPASAPAKPVWVIPPRPFVTAVVDDPAFRRFAVGEWKQAVNAALHASAGG